MVDSLLSLILSIKNGLSGFADKYYSLLSFQSFSFVVLKIRLRVRRRWKVVVKRLAGFGLLRH